MSVKHPLNVPWFKRWQCILSSFPILFSKNKFLDQDALFYAVYRGFESEREDAIIFDPFASRYINAESLVRNTVGIATTMNKTMWERYINEHGLPNEYEYRIEFLLEEKRVFASFITAYAIRTKFFDDTIENAIANGINQIVVINGGLCTRHFRLKSLTPKQNFYQILDRESLIKVERNFLKHSKPEPLCNFEQIVCPFKNGGQKMMDEIELTGLELDKPSVVIFRGLTKAFNQEQYSKFIQDVSTYFPKGSIFAADLIKNNLWGHPMEHYDCMAQYIKENNDFITETPCKIFEEAGWNCKSYTAKQLNYSNRYSKEPGSKQNNWFVQGTKK